MRQVRNAVHGRRNLVRGAIRCVAVAHNSQSREHGLLGAHTHLPCHPRTPRARAVHVCARLMCVCVCLGHFLGHWLSATSMAYENTGNTTVKAVADKMIVPGPF